MATNPDDIAQAVNILRALEAQRAKPTSESKGSLNKYVLSPLGKVLDVLDTDLNLVTQAMKPMLVSANPELQKVYDKKGSNTVPSDLIDAAIPGKGLHKVVLGFGADVLLSPTTYITGIGGLTKLGKISQKAASLEKAAFAAKAADPIKEGSKLAKQIKKAFGPGVEGRIKAGEGLAPTLAEQARRGQRSLIHIGIPFTGMDVPILKGQAIYARLDEAASAYKNSQLGKSFNKIFSTSTGNPKFDPLRQRFVALGRLYEQLSDETSAKFGKELDSLSKELGIPSEEVRRTVVALVENPDYGSLTFKALRPIHDRAITNFKLYADGTVEKKINRLPGFESLAADEKLRAHREIARELHTQQSGVNVYTAGLRVIPEKYVYELGKIFNDQANVKFLKAVGARVQYKYSKMEDILKAHMYGLSTKEFGRLEGDAALVYALVGKDEYKRVLKFKETLDKVARVKKTETALGSALAMAAKKGTGTEFDSYANTARQLVAHIDTNFTLYHSLYNANPEYLRKVNPQIYKVIDDLYNDDTWKVPALLEQFKLTKEMADKHPKLWDVAQRIRQWNQLQLQRELNAGVGTGNLLADINYLTHVPTKEIRELLQNRRGYSNAARIWSPEHANMLQREFSVIDPTRLDLAYHSKLITGDQYRRIKKYGKSSLEKMLKNKELSHETGSQVLHYMPVEEINALAKDGKLTILQNIPYQKFFDDNPANILRVRGKRGAKAIVSAEFFQSIKDNNIGIAIPKGSFAPPGYKTVAPEVLKGLAFEDDVARHIDSYYTAINLPLGSHPMLDLFDRVQDTWKAWTLAIWPTYHIRNAIGNMWNNYLAGMSHPIESAEMYTKAGQIQKLGIDKASKIKIVTEAGDTIDGARIFQEARETGILDVGQFWGDIEKYFDEEAKGILASFNKATRGPITGGLKIGRYVQNNANLAHFIWKRKQGYSALDAAASVKKYQFDYTDLTDTERLIFRRVAPFYTWTRKNIPLQIEALLMQPAKAGGVLKFKNATESEIDGAPDERLLPDWMVRNFPIRYRYNKTNKNYEYFLLGGWLPLTDIDRIFEPGKFATNMLSPFIKEPFEQMANRDFFTGREIDLGDEYENVAGFNMPKRPAHVLKKVRTISEINKFMDEDNTIDTKITNFILGKVYPLNEEKERMRLEIQFRKREINLKQQLRRAEYKNNLKEIKRISKLLEELAILQSEI